MSIASRFAGLTKLLTAAVVIALIAAAAVSVFGGGDQKQLTVKFGRTISLYEGSDVKIMGLTVGTVETITPMGDVVEVVLSYRDDIKLPQDVKAVIISPAIVGDRFVQLAPVYTGGPTIDDDAVLGLERTEVPLELDQIFQSVDDLAVALGPQGANDEGALSRLVSSTAKALDGQGEKLNQTISNFAKLSTTLSNNKDELFGSITEVEQFVNLLKVNDQTVRDFNESTAQVAKVLEDERDDLAGVLKSLSRALIDVRGLVKENRTVLRTNISDLAELSKVLVRNVDSVEASLTSAPLALANLGFTYNEKYATLDTRVDIAEVLSSLTDLDGVVCQLLGQDPSDDGLCQTLAPILDQLPSILDLIPGGLPAPPDLGGLVAPLLPRPAAQSGATVPNVQHSVEEMLAVK